MLVSATNGKTTTAAMVAEILRPRVRLAHNNSGANLVSGVASTLLHSRGAELGLFEVDEAALPEVARRVRPKALLLGNLFRDQLDRYGELELVAARWRDGGRGAPRRAARRQRRRPAGRRPRARPAAARAIFGLDDPRHARPALQHAADSKYCLRCGTPYDYAAAYVGHLGDYRCPNCGHARPPLDVVGARDRAARARRRARSRSSRPRARRGSSCALPGLYNVYNALGAASLALALGVPLDDDRRGPRALLGRVRALRADHDRRPAAADAPDQEPRRSERGGAHARRRQRRRASRSIALNDAIADGRDVSWIWDVDFEPLLAGLDRSSRRARARPSSRCGSPTAGSPRDRIEVVPSLEAALDRGLELTPAGGELTVLPTYTAMLALRRIVAARGHVSNYWESAA